MRGQALVLALMLTALAVPNAEAARIPIGASYVKVRGSLLKEGWRPVITHAVDALGDEERTQGDANVMVQAGIPEVESCSGTGFNYCFFNWRKGGACLRIETRGEYYPKYGSPTVWLWRGMCVGPQGGN